MNNDTLILLAFAIIISSIAGCVAIETVSYNQCTLKMATMESATKESATLFRCRY